MFTRQQQSLSRQSYFFQNCAGCLLFKSTWNWLWSLIKSLQYWSQTTCGTVSSSCHDLRAFNVSAKENKHTHLYCGKMELGLITYLITNCLMYMYLYFFCVFIFVLEYLPEPVQALSFQDACSGGLFAFPVMRSTEAIALLMWQKITKLFYFSHTLMWPVSDKLAISSDLKL